MENTYIIYCTDKDGCPEVYNVFGTTRLKETLKRLHSMKATDISIYEEGKDFENNPDDIIELLEIRRKI